MQLVYIGLNDESLPDLNEIPEEDLASPIQEEVSETQDILNPESHQEEIGNQQQPSETGNVQDVNPSSSAVPPTLPPRSVIESERFMTS